MKSRRIVSYVFLLSGLISLGVILFADILGLDDHSGWGRTRILALIANVLFITCIVIYLKYQAAVEVKIETLMQRSSFTTKILVFCKKYGFTLPIAALVIVIYIWLVSSGTWTQWVSPTRYYANLAKGFENGNLFLPGAPHPRLSELPNPYDPVARKDIDVPVDLSYYNGRYYLYWGPVPALMIVPIQSAFQGRVGDLQLTFAFTCGIFLLLSILLIRIWDVYFHDLPKWLLGLSILLAGLSNPILFMLNNFKGARIYEAAITGGQFFLVGGILAVITTIGKPLSPWKLMLSGFLFVLAIGTRFFLLLPIGAIALTLFYVWFQEKDSLMETIKRISYFALPLILGGLAIGWYNWARFGSFTETGFSYALAGVNLQKNNDLLIQPIYFLQNFYNYIFHPFSFNSQFPFVQVDYGRIAPLLSVYPLPNFYSAQQTTGLLFTVPFIVFACLPLLSLITRKYKDDQHSGNSLSSIVLICTASLVTAFLFLMCFFWSAMRYLEDFMPALLILSMIGFWQGYKSLLDKPTKLGRFIFLSLALAFLSVLLSVLLAMSINDARFEIIQLFVRP
jgi:hypothetical protein